MDGVPARPAGRFERHSKDIYAVGGCGEDLALLFRGQLHNADPGPGLGARGSICGTVFSWVSWISEPYFDVTPSFRLIFAWPSGNTLAREF